MLFALVYRLFVLHFASHILPTIGADSWETETGVDNGWEGRPVSEPRLFHWFYADWVPDFQVDVPPPDLPAIYLRNGLFPSTQ